MTSSARTNDQWVDELRAGDDAALGDLREVLRRGLARALARKSNVSAADIEDFAQDGVLRALDRLDSYRGDSRFTTWAHAVAINSALTELRRQRWKDKALEEVDASGHGPVAPGGNPAPAR